MNHEESIIQRQSVAWFRAQYPQFSMLLIHPINEGSGHSRIDRMRQGIHKAEGAVAGVSDLLFFMPAKFEDLLHGLSIEFKTPKGSLSQAQKDFQKIFEAAGYGNTVVRSLEDFKVKMNWWISHAVIEQQNNVCVAYNEITKAAEEREKEKFYKIIGKK